MIKCAYNGLMPRHPARTNITEFGKRLSELRKAAGSSQVEVAETLNIPQRTVSYYEREGKYLPSNLVEPLAKLFGVTVDVILGMKGENPTKRGPKSKLERQFEEVQKLSRTKQEFISKLLSQILTAESA